MLLDSRSAEAWAQGHVPGAVHLPGREIPARAAGRAGPSVPVVTYCWGPGCNGATRAALALALLGYRVREMLGGFEYWAREGLPVATADGVHRPDADPLTAAGVGQLRLLSSGAGSSDSRDQISSSRLTPSPYR